MAETLEPPPMSDTDALKASFNTSLQEQTGVDPKATDTDDAHPGEQEPQLVPQKVETKVETKADKEESIVPDQFTGKTEANREEPQIEEIPVNAGTKQLRDVLARRDAKLKEQTQTLEELRKKLETAPITSSKEHDDRVAAALKRAQEAELRLEKVAYSESPKFQRFNAEHVAEISSAKSYLEGTEISPSILEIAANQTGQARLATLRNAGMDAETIAAVGPHLARADAIRRERDASLENWKANMTVEQQAQQAQAAQQEQQRQQQEQVVLNEVREAKMKDNPAFTKVPGHDKWNAMVEQNIRDAEDFAMGRKPLKDLFDLGYDGVSARTFKVMNAELTKKVNAQAEQIARLTAAQPGTGRAADPKAGEAGKPVDETSEYKASFNREMEKVNGRG